MSKPRGSFIVIYCFVVCVCPHLYVGVYMCVKVYLKANKGQLWYLSSGAIHLIFGGRVPQWDLGLTDLAGY